ncbi:MAG: molybdopterin molybdotransferase MoeA [Candidatus Kariarchaeaceae archaeon]|jgi:molybdenum cofactor synthesis domain-containing protein
MKKGFKTLTSVSEALNTVISEIKPLKSEIMHVKDCLSRVLVDDIVARYDVPMFDRSAMDGYAIRSEDSFGASVTDPVYLKITGRIEIGTIPDIEVQAGEAAQIMTGSALPKGTDAVIKVEDTREHGNTIEVIKPYPPRKNVSTRGEDVRQGDVILKQGHLLHPHDIGIIIASGHDQINVISKPKVSIISTGSELIDPGERLEPGKIFDVNNATLSSLVSLYHSIPFFTRRVKDDRDELLQTLEKAIEQTDVIVFSGGSSVGEHDIIDEVIQQKGKLLVQGVAMRPGAPTLIGIVDNKPVFGLPGSPVASIISFDVFVRPTLQALLGMKLYDSKPIIRAKLKRSIPSEVGRRDFARVRIVKENNELFAELVRVRGSGIISTLVKADGIVEVSEEREGLSKGDSVNVKLFSQHYFPSS